MQLLAQKAVNADASFSYETHAADTTNLFPGQYFVVAQHPMQNNIFDIYSAPYHITASNTPD